jgi:hypothetical protein
MAFYVCRVMSTVLGRTAPLSADVPERKAESPVTADAQLPGTASSHLPFYRYHTLFFAIECHPAELPPPPLVLDVLSVSLTSLVLLVFVGPFSVLNVLSALVGTLSLSALSALSAHVRWASQFPERVQRSREHTRPAHGPLSALGPLKLWFSNAWYFYMVFWK